MGDIAHERVERSGAGAPSSLLVALARSSTLALTPMAWLDPRWPERDGGYPALTGAGTQPAGPRPTPGHRAARLGLAVAIVCALVLLISVIALIAVRG
jgi:hypothetical protein